MPKARAWLEIDLGAIIKNARALVQQAAPASLCAVVKSNGYGHGMGPVARALQEADIAGLRFGVFDLSEATLLRDAGISAPIIVLGPIEETEIDDAATLTLEVALLDDRLCEAFAGHRVAAHVKVDTGLNRFGIARQRAAAALQRCRELGVNIAGIYSHLANAEDLDKEFTLEQVERLRRVAVEFTRPSQARANLTDAKDPTPVLHIAASAAAMMWPQTRLDMVRCGIALYGAWPSPEVHAFMAGEAPSFELAPALRWFAPIVQVRDVRSGETVGYGRAFTARRDSRIAMLPLGYSDGFPRAAGMGKARVRVKSANSHSIHAPIVGRVCMNVCMLDVTELAPQPTVGDIVELDVDDIARAAGTINYEILAALPAHLERRYRETP